MNNWQWIQKVLTKQDRHVKLSWELLEHKYRYYVLNAGIIEDYDYDMLEKEYDRLCEDLHKPMSVSDMVGWDDTRPSCQLVARKLGEKHVVRKTKRKKEVQRKTV